MHIVKNMRNLKKIESIIVQNELWTSIRCACVDFDTTSIYCCSDDTIFELDPATFQVSKKCEFKQPPSTSEDDCSVNDALISGYPIVVEFLSEDQLCVVVTTAGEVFQWCTFDGSIEVVGNIDSGVLGAEWSPDRDLIAMVTGEYKLLLMSRSFDIVLETSLFTEEFGEAENVNVGWGSKATQFHGSEGKNAAHEPKQVATEVTAHQSSATCVSWSADAAYFCVSAVHPCSRVRKMSVYQRDASLFSRAQELSCVEQCFKFSVGCRIVGGQRVRDRLDILFYEHNGRLHHKFTLASGCSSTLVLRQLAVDVGQVALAALTEDTADGSQTLQFWTVDNFTWSMKQQLWFPSDDRVTFMFSDPEVKGRFSVFTSAGHYKRVTFQLAYNREQSSTTSLGTVVSIHKGEIRCTPFSVACVPPPEYAYSFNRCPTTTTPTTTTPTVTGVSFYRGHYAVLYDDLLLALTSSTPISDESTDGIKFEGTMNKAVNSSCPSCPPVYLNYIDLKQVVPDLCDYDDLYHFTALTSTRFVVVAASKSLQFHLISINLNTDNTLHSVETNMLSSSVRDVCSVENKFVLIHCEDCTLSTYNPSTNKFNEDIDITSFPQKCSSIAYCLFNGAFTVLRLTPSCRLYANGVEISNECVSFIVHTDFLILTTHSQKMKFISLKKDLSDLSMNCCQYSRLVERMARICTVLSCQVVLQMPRGNIEFVEPRILLFSHFKILMRRLHYKECFLMVKKHRIDFNILFDHDPQMFCDNLALFIDQLNDPNYINLFLSSLKDEDFSVTLYSNYYEDRKPITINNKRNEICKMFKNKLEKMDSEKYLLSIITSLVTRSPPLLSEALNHLNSLKDEGKKASTLKYLMFLVPVDKLYDTALGMYDFNLTVYVAERSLKDPKEYIPYLNELKNLSPIAYRRYQINFDLRNFPLALNYISKCPGKSNFEKALSLITNKKLYKQALTIYKKGPGEYKEISQAYGAYLTCHHRFSAAGLILSRAGDHFKAAQAFCSDLDWQSAVRELKLSGKSEADQLMFLRRFAEVLEESHKITDAAHIFDEYLDNADRAIEILITAHEWKFALRLMAKHNRMDYVQTDLIAGVDEALLHYLSTMERASQEFTSYVGRLQDCRQRKIQQQELSMADQHYGSQGDSDLYSETSSIGGGAASETGWTVVSEGVVSIATTRTNASRVSRGGTKNNRRNDRKKHSLRKGGVHEETALVDVLAKIVVAMDNMKDDIANLLHVLVYLDKTSQAEKLQIQFQQHLSTIESLCPFVWISDNNKNSLQVDYTKFGPNCTVNDITRRIQTTNISSDENPNGEQKIEMPHRKQTKWKMSILETNQ